MRAVVLGASGVVGRALLPHLARRADVVAVSRHPPQIDGIESLAADVTDVAGLRRALDGADVVYHLVHSLGSADFSERDRVAARAVATAAGDAGVQQIVFLGGLGDDRAGLSEHLRSRLETARILRDGPVPVTTLQAAVIVGPGSAGFETIVALVDRLPAMIAPRWISTPTQPIALEDVAVTLAAVAGRAETLGQSYDLGGPEVLTYREMIERVGRIRGHRPLIVEVPVLTPWLSALWLHLVTPVRAGVARPLIEGLRTPTVAREQAIREVVPLQLTPFDEAARQALAGATRAAGPLPNSG